MMYLSFAQAFIFRVECGDMKYQSLLMIGTFLVTCGLVYLNMPADLILYQFSETKCDHVVFTKTLGLIDVSNKVLGTGAFSLVLQGQVRDTDMSVAIKIGMTHDSGIERDARILSSLNGTENFPLYYGTDYVRCERGGKLFNYPFIAMELLGDSVASFTEKKQVFLPSINRIEPAIRIGQGIVNGLRVLHEQQRYIMHDVYPRNIVLPRDTSSASVEFVPKLIDFGESIKIFPGGSIGYNRLNRLYTSVREDLNLPLGPRDDIERVVYLIVSIYRGGVMPWNFPERDMDRIPLYKAQMTIDDICTGLPTPIKDLLTYARSGNLSASDIPDFEYINSLFEEALSRFVKTHSETSLKGPIV
jgi:serine/threonine protein kinase